MSMQSDIEILSIQAMEAFAKRSHISGEDVMGPFHSKGCLREYKICWEGLL